MTITARPGQAPADTEPPERPAEPDKLSVLGGLAALSPDAMASVAYVITAARLLRAVLANETCTPVPENAAVR